MMKKEQTIQRGIYLIVDPTKDTATTLCRLESALTVPLAAVQIWDPVPGEVPDLHFIAAVVRRCHSKRVPVLLNNRWQTFCQTDADGIHFDAIPQDFSHLRQCIRRPFLCGLTCDNDLSKVRWAHAQQLDYLSFCSLFPSATRNSCERIRFDTIREAREITDLPLFLAGGIQPAHLPRLSTLPFDGIAVVSGIMQSPDPAKAARTYYQQIQTCQP